LQHIQLSEALHRPVLHTTGVAGKFDLKLEWTPDDMQVKPPSADQPAGNAPETDAGPSIFAALQEQLGLNLEPARFRPKYWSSIPQKSHQKIEKLLLGQSYRRCPTASFAQRSGQQQVAAS
jgi:hypothetical protein